MVSSSSFTKWRRGVSPVVATVLIIALTVATSAAVWIIATQLLESNASFTSVPQSAFDYNHDGLVDAMSLKVSNPNNEEYNISYVSLDGWEVFNKENLTAGSEAVITVYTSLSSKQLEGSSTLDIGFSPVPVITSLSTITVPSPTEVEAITVSYLSAGEPISGAYVSFEMEDGSPVNFPATPTDSNGEISATLLPGYYIAKTSGYQSDLFTNIDTHQVTINGANSESVFVRVVDNSGAPLEGLTVYNADTSQNDLGSSGITNATGYTQFTLLQGDYLFHTNYLSQEFWSSQLTIPNSGSNVLTIQIKSGFLAGRVVYGSENVNQTYWVRLYTSTNSYLRKQIRLNTNGEFNFTSGVTSGVYKIRLYANNRWWIFSDIVSSATQNLIVDYGGGQLVTNVTTGGEPLVNVRTYLYLSTGSYMGWKRTNGSGFADYGLYPGLNMKLRTITNGIDTYSGNFTHDGTVRSIDFAGGKLDVLLTTAGIPFPDKSRVYLFTTTGRYTGKWDNTNSSGWASFGTVLGGDFKIRIDWMRAYKFTDNFTHSDNSPQYLDTEGGRLQVQILAGGSPIQNNVRTYLFTDSPQRYTGRWDNSNSSGWLDYGVVIGNVYKIRVDWLGQRIYTSNFTHNDNSTHVLSIEGYRLVANITVGGQPIPQNVRTYLFTDSPLRYAGRWKNSNSSGMVDYGILLNNTYRLRVDWLGARTYTDPFVLNGSVVTLNLAGDDLTIKLTIGGLDVPAGARTYLFTSGNRYVGRWQNTDSSSYLNYGIILAGDYKIRLDYQGQRLYSGVFTHDGALQTIDYNGGNMTVQIQAGGQPIRAGVRLYLFTSGNRYTGRWQNTNGTGHGNFGVMLLGTYKVRIDWLSKRTFTATFDHQNTSTYTLNDATGGPLITQVQVGGQAVPGNTRVYLYTSDSRYTGIWQNTNNTGHANFSVVLGGDYIVRLYHARKTYYSTAFTHDGQSNYTTNFTGVGTMTITITSGASDGNNIQLWHNDGTYAGFQTTVSGGQVVFNAIPAGDYYIRNTSTGTNSGTFTAASAVSITIP